MLLNDGFQTYISDATGSMAAPDITSMDSTSALFYTWKVGKDPWNSDYFSVTIEYNGIIDQEKPAKRLLYCKYNKDMDWTAFMEKIKEKITEVKTQNGRNKERDVKERYENFI
jgi:hypothetical protein